MKSTTLDRLFNAGFAFFDASTDRDKLAVTLICSVAIGYVLSLAGLAIEHRWLLDAQGNPVPCDFVAFWAAGHLALTGQASRAYDPHIQHAAEVALVGHQFKFLLGWLFPPLFFFVAAPLACFGYVFSLLVWVVATVAFYAGVAAAIARRRIAFVAALAAPWVLMGLWQAQTSFLSAGIVGATLLHLERRPLLSGFVLALLSYKPQFGLLFPVALAAGGYWRAFGSAALSLVALNGLAVLVFGSSAAAAFLHSLAGTMQSHVTSAEEGWGSLQSLYGLARSLGLSSSVAWSAQAVFSTVLATCIAFLWHSRLPYALKAGVLAVAVPLATPYILVHDLSLLTIAIAFFTVDRRFDRTEIALLAATIPGLLPHYWVDVPTAIFSSMAVAAIGIRRCYQRRLPASAALAI